MGNCSEFERITRWAVSHISFNMDKTVSVFETNIRIIGGLISAHKMAVDPNQACFKDPSKPYDYGLLRLAHDLGLRLLPAFNTSTGMPYGSINLRHGVDKDESNVTAAATVGTMTLEFWTLSQLTRDPRFAMAAKRAVKAMWAYRSPLNLIGAHINIQNGEWVQKDSGIGGLVDSFYEYLLKAAVMTSDPEYLAIFNKAYSAVMSTLKVGPWYIDVHMDSGAIAWPHFASLQCFWPGLQAMIGDVEAAAETIEIFTRMWLVYGGLPEVYNLHTHEMTSPGYPLRPELIESAMYMHQTTNDPAYLALGKEILNSLETICKVECGYAGIANVMTRELNDSMDSFFLAETCKYLFLLFDTDNFIRRGPYIFNTEGHPFLLDTSRPTMTAARQDAWEGVFNSWLPEDKDSGTDNPHDSSQQTTGKSTVADRFVHVRGQCLIPPFYAHISSRGLNTSMLTTEELLEPYLTKEQKENQAQMDQQIQNMLAQRKMHAAAEAAAEAASGESGGVLSGMKDFLSNLFQAQGGSATQQAQVGSAADGSAIVKVGNMRMSMGKDGQMIIRTDGGEGEISEGNHVTFHEVDDISAGATCPAELPHQPAWATPWALPMCLLDLEVSTVDQNFDAVADGDLSEEETEAEAAAAAAAAASDLAAVEVAIKKRRIEQVGRDAAMLAAAVLEEEKRVAQVDNGNAESKATEAAKMMAAGDVRWRTLVAGAESKQQAAMEAQVSLNALKKRPPRAGNPGDLPSPMAQARDTLAELAGKAADAAILASHGGSKLADAANDAAAAEELWGAAHRRQQLILKSADDSQSKTEQSMRLALALLGCDTNAVVYAPACVTTRDRSEWWAYQLCHMKNVSQFHDQVTWSLGELQRGEASEDCAESADEGALKEKLDAALLVPATDDSHAVVESLISQIEAISQARQRQAELAFVFSAVNFTETGASLTSISQKFNGGQPCDETGRPRHSEVHYVCEATFCRLAQNPDFQNSASIACVGMAASKKQQVAQTPTTDILIIDEFETCGYRVFVSLPPLCKIRSECPTVAAVCM
jgi:mannosidase alpha-like ER degradation enhancer 2